CLTSPIGGEKRATANSRQLAQRMLRRFARNVNCAIDLLLVLAALPVLIGSLHLGALALLAFRMPPPSARTRYRFTIVVPAHDEEGGIQKTVSSLLRIAYPKELYRVVVVADNCSDRTA